MKKHVHKIGHIHVLENYDQMLLIRVSVLNKYGFAKSIKDLEFRPSNGKALSLVDIRRITEFDTTSKTTKDLIFYICNDHNYEYRATTKYKNNKYIP